MRKHARTVLVRAGQTLGLGVVFVGAAVAGLVVNANSAPMRRLVVSVTNDALKGIFRGPFVIGDLTYLSLGTEGHVRVAQAEIKDPEGHRVILARGIDARIDLVRLVRSVLKGGAPEVFLDSARIDSADVQLDFDAQGEIGVARAFLPLPGTKPKPTPTNPNLVAEDVRLSIEKAYVQHAHVQGNVVPPRLDADADEVHAGVFIFDNRLTVRLDDARTTVRSPRAPGQASDVHGKANGELGVPLSATRADIAMHWDLAGDASGIPLTAKLVLEHDRLTATADVAEASPEIVKGAFPALPISRPVELHAKAEGELTKELAITATGHLGGAELRATGALGLTGKQPFRLDADLVHVDGAALAGPASDLAGHVHAEGVIAGVAPSGTFTAQVKEGTLGGQRTPAIDAEGRFDDKKIDGSFRANEPGATAVGEITVRLPEQTLDFDVRAAAKDLRKLARAPNMVSGSGTAHATGTVDLGKQTIAARVVADGRGIALSPAQAESVHAEATVSGPLASPVADVTASATRIRLSADSKAPIAYPSATAHARVSLVPTPVIVDATVHVDGASAEDGASIDASAREIRFGGGGGVQVSGVRITGLGAPIELEVSTGGGSTSIRARGTDLDMKRVSAMTGITQLRLLPEGSRASLDVDLRASGQRTDGHVDVTIAGAKDGTAAELHAKLDKGHVSARGRATVGTMGWVEITSAELEVAGRLDAASLRRATGVVDLRGELDLAQGGALFGGESIEKMSGTALLSARIERLDPRNLPTVYGTARTRDLDVTLNRDGTSTHVSGIDASVHVGYDGATDQSELSVITWDGKGVLVTADAKAVVPLFGWITGAQPFDRDVVGRLALGGVLDVQRRDVSALPGIFARPDLDGALALHADFAGSIARPIVTLVARADGLAEKRKGSERNQKFAPIDGVIEARWNGSDLVATMTADESERRGEPEREGRNKNNTEARKSGHVRGLVLARIPSADLFAGRPLAWNASAELDVADMSLAPLPLPMNVRGALTGRVKLRDFATEPVLEANAQIDGLGLGGARVKSGAFEVHAQNGSIDASARVTQDDGGSGQVKLVSSSLKWRGVDLGWDDAQPSRIDYTLDRFRLSILRPLVRRFMPEIDGQVDGTGSATVDAKNQVFQGGVAVSGGRIYLNAIGEEISDISAVARFERDGGFRIQDATGKIGSGELKGSASGRMKGLSFQSAEAVVVVPSKEGVPLSAEGATFAQATGEVRVSAKVSPDRKSLVVDVVVPRSKITVPKRATQNLQSLDPDETIKVGLRQPDGSLTPPKLRPGEAKRSKAAAAAAAAAAARSDDALPPDAFAARFTVVLGNDIVLEGRGLRLGLTGRTVVDLADEIAVTGQIQLKNGGTIDVQGRKFVVDRGTVTFVAANDPSDPIVIAAAYWDAPDRTRVWVEFNGPLKTGKLTLRSEPPYSKNEILSILLFGRADPNQAPSTDRPSDAQQATAVGTGIVSGGLNKALGDLDEDFDLEQDRTSANRVRTKVGYRLRRNLKVQLGYASGFSQREPDTTYLFLEWQFIPQWSLIGTRGDRGTSILDVLFQHRY